MENTIAGGCKTKKAAKESYKAALRARKVASRAS